MSPRPFVPKELRHTAEEGPRFVREGFLYFGLIQACLALVRFGVLPPWALAVALPPLMVRMMIGRHELIHLRTAEGVDVFTRLWPVLTMITPLSLGFREYRFNHDLHHEHTITDRDPDMYQMSGTPLQGLFATMTAPEQDAVRWVVEHGLDRRLALEVAARALIFGVLAGFAGPVFLWYWLPLRLTYGAALFVFTYGLHRRGEEYGTYAVVIPPWAITVVSVVFGRTAWGAVFNHDVHHADARIAADHLDDARPYLAVAPAEAAPSAALVGHLDAHAARMPAVVDAARARTLARVLAPLEDVLSPADVAVLADLAVAALAYDDLADESDLPERDVALRAAQWTACATGDDCPECAFDPAGRLLRGVATALARSPAEWPAWERACARLFTPEPGRAAEALVVATVMLAGVPEGADPTRLSELGALGRALTGALDALTVATASGELARPADATPLREAV